MKAILLSLAFFLILGSSHAQGTFENPETLVRALYQEVSFTAGDIPDWEFASSLFIQEAVSTGQMTLYTFNSKIDNFTFTWINFPIELHRGKNPASSMQVDANGQHPKYAKKIYRLITDSIFTT